jgi:hypothetical protein
MERIKSFVGDFFGFNQTINNLYSRLGNEETNIVNLKQLLQQEEDKVTKYQARVNQLVSEVELLNESLNKEKDPLAEHWNNKYPTANISYLGRTWGTTKNRIEIDVRLFITPQDFHIHDILKQKNLYYVPGTSIDDHIIKIYHFVKANYYKYAFDSNNYGVDEYWEFPFEMLQGLKNKLTDGYDCDSWAHFITSFLIASGVPEWKVRVVVGMSKLGGHSTVYVHCDKTDKFHHINSTYGHLSSMKDLSKYPTTDDAKTTDAIGIYSVWFSFNNLLAWHKFSSEARQDYKIENGGEIYSIK